MCFWMPLPDIIKKKHLHGFTVQKLIIFAPLQANGPVA